MRLVEIFKGTQGIAPPRMMLVKEILDDTRHVSAFASTHENPKNTMLIAFDGTLGPMWPPSKDWIRDLEAWPKKYAEFAQSFKACEGFLDEYLTLRDELLRQVQIYRPEEITVAGFSQGEAHAVLMMIDLLFRFKMPIRGIGFGGPRVLNTESALWLENDMRATIPATFTQFRLWGDPVPSAVPAFLGYRHVGQVRHIGPFKLFFDPSVHSGANYIKALETLE